MWKRFGGRGYQNVTFYPSWRVPLMRVTGTTNHDHRTINSLAYVHIRITMHYNDMPANNTPLCT
jgi:hypothetical protein